MKSEELLNKLKTVRKQIILNQEEISRLKAEKERINNILTKSIVFNLNELTSYLCSFVSDYNDENYLYAYNFLLWYTGIKCKIFLRPDDEHELDIFHIKEEDFYRFDSIVPIYYAKKYVSPVKENFTYQFLLDKYNVEFDEKINISKNNFNNHEYVKEFINYLVDLRVEKDGKMLTKKEVYDAINDFINMYKSKPNTRILNKKD